MNFTGLLDGAIHGCGACVSRSALASELRWSADVQGYVEMDTTNAVVCFDHNSQN